MSPPMGSPRRRRCLPPSEIRCEVGEIVVRVDRCSLRDDRCSSFVGHCTPSSSSSMAHVVVVASHLCVVVCSVA
ncbi:hypothetical protein DEO72_LG8g642 [Vigna unguiculata]|uniref:Uncharacterized protein n=1 Tax=Vigna unguiculata TaxID=3917 RepID=A0A4D6MRQ3_VIGUN|nr:hypothetical protein DEO72_LG8g642 [Vigna unguiculata]